MMHFRGLQLSGVWQPLCSTKDDPATGDVTTTARDVTCGSCRRIIGMKGETTPWDRRPRPASSEEDAADTERRIR